MTLDTSNVQHEKLVLRLVEPAIPGFSVAPAPAKTGQDDVMIKPVKRCSKEEEITAKKRIKKWKFPSNLFLRNTSNCLIIIKILNTPNNLAEIYKIRCSPRLEFKTIKRSIRYRTQAMQSSDLKMQKWWFETKKVFGITYDIFEKG